MKLSRFLLITAVYNALLGAALLSSGLRELLGVDLAYPGNQMIAGFLWFTTVVLMISSSDVKRYASIIYYEAHLRFLEATIMLVAVIAYDFGVMLALAAMVDVLIGLYYLVRLKKETPYRYGQLLTNRIA